MRVFSRLRQNLTYANVMATIAMFLALGGGAYAISVPRNSVGSSQLKGKAVTAHKIARNAVTSPTVKDFSLLAKDFKSGHLARLVGARTNDTDPAADSKRLVLGETTLSTKKAGRIFVLATVRDSFLTCRASGPCSAQWGIYVDERPVPDTGLRLSPAAGASDGHSFDLLYGTTVDIARGTHSVKLARVDSGQIDSAGQLDVQVGAVALD